MFTIKTFIKKTKVGNYLKSVREHYLRDDIACGLKSCDECQLIDSNLSSSHVNTCSLIEGNHYLIVDTNVVLDQIDILEESVIGNVIILHTVLQEVKHRSLPTYKRLCTIIDNPTKHFYVFVNDHHKDTNLTQNEKETTNDYNDRCIRNACKWYINHLPETTFVFLTDDAANRKLAIEDNIKTYSVSDYVEHMDKTLGLQDKLFRKDFHSADRAKDLFPNHLTPVEIITGIRAGKLIQGTFKASQDNFLEGFVMSESTEDSVI